jgi:hypothetical protein
MRILFKLLAYIFLKNVDKKMEKKAKKEAAIESKKITIKGLTDIEHIHHL